MDDKKFFIKYSNLLYKYVSAKSIDLLYKNWTDPQRIYHNIDHLNDLIFFLEENAKHVNKIEFDALILAAFFHDAIYNIKNYKKHEFESSKFFYESYISDDNKMKNKVLQLIEVTAHRRIPNDPLCKIFWKGDNDGFIKDFDIFLENELKIRKEFKHISNFEYKKGKIKFLKSNIGLFGKKGNENIHKLIDWVKTNY